MRCLRSRIIFLSLGIVIFGFCASTTGFLVSRPLLDREDAGKTLRARSLIITDEQNRDRIQLLGSDSSAGETRGQPVVALLDKDGLRRALLSQLADGTIVLSFFGPSGSLKGDPLLNLRANPDACNIGVHDGKNGTIGLIAIDGKPMLNIQSGEAQVYFKAWPTGESVLNFYSKSKNRIMVGVNKDGEQIVKQFDKSGSLAEGK